MSALAPVSSFDLTSLLQQQMDQKMREVRYVASQQMAGLKMGAIQDALELAGIEMPIGEAASSSCACTDQNDWIG